MTKKIIITGCPRTGTTALTSLLYNCANALVTNELGTFHPDKQVLIQSLEKIGPHNIKALGLKGWTKQDLQDFVDQKCTNSTIELFGDKRPDYCFTYKNAHYLTQRYSDAYFIFTHRHPCAVAYSFLKRSRVEPDPASDWYATNAEEAINKILLWTTNWLTLIYPFVKNKIIIDYDDHAHNVPGLVKTLNSFFQMELDILEPEKLYYRNNLTEFADNLSDNEINMINYKYSIVGEYIDRLKKDTPHDS